MVSPGKSRKVLLISAILFWFALPSMAQSSLPEGNGKEIVEIVCSQCHGLNNVTDARRTLEEWESVVSDMVARGAPLLIDEIDAVSAYLTKNFGPQSPSGDSSRKAASANAATTMSEGAGKEIVETVCTQCHGLNTVSSAGYGSRGEWRNVVDDMVSRGAPLRDDEIDVVAEYLAATFGAGASPGSSASASGQSAATSSAAGILPDGKGKEIVEMVCSQCHGLNNVAGSRRTLEEWDSVVSDMVARGAPLLIDEIDSVTSYLAEHFGP